ncbi:MAG TPA: fluoride efflux transporter CrcB [Rectinemataceae bacterium]
MRNMFLIFAGGGLGAVARYGASKAINALAPYALPLGTLFVNVSGSFVLGLVIALVDLSMLSEQARLFIAVGFLGAYTTFSTFAVESIGLAKEGALTTALWNFILNNALAGGAVLLGFAAAQALGRGRAI